VCLNAEGGHREASPTPKSPINLRRSAPISNAFRARKADKPLGNREIRNRRVNFNKFLEAVKPCNQNSKQGQEQTYFLPLCLRSSVLSGLSATHRSVSCLYITVDLLTDVAIRLRC
jgi:hypothetical protein